MLPSAWRGLQEAVGFGVMWWKVNEKLKRGTEASHRRRNCEVPGVQQGRSQEAAPRAFHGAQIPALVLQAAKGDLGREGHHKQCTNRPRAELHCREQENASTKSESPGRPFLPQSVPCAVEGE